MSDRAPNLRWQCVQTLMRLEKEPEAVERALNRTDGELADAHARAFRRTLVYGVLENRRLIDFQIDRHSKKPIQSQKPVVRSLLRAGCYELFFMQTPPHAVVHELVKLAAKKASYVKGYVNALLRGLLRDAASFFAIDTGNAMQDLAIRYSLPDWMLLYLSDIFSEDDLPKLLETLNAPSPIGLFLPPDAAGTSAGKTAKDRALEELSGVLKNVRPSTISEHALLCDGGPITESPWFQNGQLSIQSAPSLRVAELATEGVTGGRILDLCAAPGSKSIAMKRLAQGADVTANDLAPEKLRYIEENAARMHAPVHTTSGDGRVFRPEWEAAFDVVLVDAPCSGLGLLGRKPDIRWNRTREDIDALAKLQKEILPVAARYVKPGGRLVYSTCTYGRAENEDVVATLPEDVWENEPVDGQEALHFSPLQEMADGFFMTRFRRR